MAPLSDDDAVALHRLVRGEMAATVVNASNPGELIMPRTMAVTAYTVPSIRFRHFQPYNVLPALVCEVETNGILSQYQQMDRASITLGIPEDIAFPEDESAAEYSLTNGYIFGSMYSASSPFDTLYQMTDTGVGTNFSAVGVSFVLSRLADIPITVHQKVTYDLKIDVVDEAGVVPDYIFSLTDRDGNVLTADEDGIFRGLGYGEYGYTLTKFGYVRQNATLKLGSADAEDVVDGILTKTITIVQAAENAWDGTSATEPAAIGGVYQIGTGAELAWFAQTVNGGTTGISAVLTADIDLAGYDWTPIGNTTKRFAGKFDGQGHKIYNFSIAYSKTSIVPYQVSLVM